MNGADDHKTSVIDWFKAGGSRLAGESAEGARVWRLFLRVFIFTLIFEGLLLFPGEPGLFTGRVIVFCGLFAWFNVVSLLLVDSGGARKWLLLLGGSLLCLFAAPSWVPGWIAAAVITFFFLFFRRYKPYRHLSSRRRAAAFLLLAAGLTLLIFSRFDVGLSFLRGLDVEVSKPFTETVDDSAPSSLESPDAAGARDDTGQASSRVDKSLFQIRILYTYTSMSLLVFYALSLAHIFLGLRLHFMKLRPKLAIAAFLITVVPFVLVVIMGTLVCYHTLGTTRALRVESLLEEWARIATSEPGIRGTLSAETFSMSKDGDRIEYAGVPAPWAPAFSEALLYDPLSPFAAWSGADTTAYFSVGGDVWMIGIMDAREETFQLHGSRIDTVWLDRISEMLRIEVYLSAPLTTTLSTPENTLLLSDDDFKQLLFTDERHGTTGRGPTDPETAAAAGFLPGLLATDRYFGMINIEIQHFADGRFGSNVVLVMLEASIADLVGELLSGENLLSFITMLLLGALALLMLVLELFALFFGVRITTGILAAIRALVKGTRRISDGDLDTRIEIPNQDELGRLADSFNRMTAAVKRGIEEAVLREQLERELKTAREIQERLLPPEVPSIQGYDIAGTSIPSRFVGGDYFDFLELDADRLGIAIGDVSGKGIPAALLMANLQASLHGQTMDHQEVSAIITRMNELLVRSTDPHMFASFFYGVLDREGSMFTATNAGHNPPLLLRADGGVEKFEAGGVLLGIRAGSDYGQQAATVSPGDVIVLYTDGITEALKGGESGEDAEMFGEERLTRVVSSAAAGSAEGIKNAILSAVSGFTNNTPLSDDITLVVLKRDSQPG